MTKERLLLIVLLGAVVGCDREPSGNNSAAKPDDRSGQSPPSIAAAPTSRPTTSRMTISDREYLFPASRLLLERGDGNLVVLLFSDDARAALAANYRGNRYHLRFQLDTADPAKIGGRDCVIRAPSQERIDSPDGIFLEGDRRQLQPHDVHVQFTRAGDDLQVELSGTFLMFGGRDEKSAPVPVPVQGSLVAELEGLKKARGASQP